MTSAYIVTGTLTDGQSVRLDEPLPVRAAKVRVTVEVVEQPAARESLDEFLAALRTRQAARGHQPRTRQEIDAALRVERDGWE